MSVPSGSGVEKTSVEDYSKLRDTLDRVMDILSKLQEHQLTDHRKLHLFCLEANTRLDRLEVRLNGTDAGEQKTVKPITHTCESTVSENECPTCGHRLRPLTNAERQRRYREKSSQP